MSIVVKLSHDFLGMESVDGLKYSKDQSESVTQKQTWDKFAAA